MLKDDDLLRLARERFEEAYEEDHWNRDQAIDDLEFLAGEQWPDAIRVEREEANRPILVINRMPQFLRQVTGDIRKTNPSISISPGDDDADNDLAEVYEGLVRQIERCSDAQSVYEGSAESAASCGMGWFRVLTDYESRSFNQEIKLERIYNPLSVYCDPQARDVTRKDARYIFVVDMLEQEQFEEQFPGKKVSSWESSGMPEYLSHWYDGDRVLIAEYFWREPVTRHLGQMEDGRVVDMDEPGSALIPVVRTRKFEDYDVYWAKLSGEAVLTKPRKLSTRFIPIVGVIGEEMHIGERLVRSSVIRYAKDAQRMYNYWRSAQTEVIALQPKAPFKVTPKHIGGLEPFWDDINTSNRPYVVYNPDPSAPPPQRENPPVPSTGMMQEIALAADDMKATTGIYDSALGEKSNESSGVAIRQRQLESDVSTSIYVDNLAKSIAHCGRIIVDMIPSVYDTNRMIRVLGQDEAEKIVEVNKPVLTPSGPLVVNDLSRGKYDVVVKTGPGYSTRRQEAADAQLEFIRAVPNVAQFVMDLIARNMDWPGAEEFADRLQKILPPGVVERDVSEMTPEEQQAYMMEQQAAQQAKAMQEAIAQMEMRQAEADVQKSEAGAMKDMAQAQETQVEAALKGIELVVKRGLLAEAEATRMRLALLS